MKRKLNYIISTFFIAGTLMTPVVAIAHAEDSTNTSTDSTTTSTSDDSTETSKIESQNSDMSDRISKFKEHFKVKLTTLEGARIKLKCGGAQKVVGTLNTKFGNSITVRTQAYTELQKNLDKLVTKLKAKNVDTTTLESQITELKAKITTYSTDLTAYKQSLSDLKAVDCKTDPDGFQAALLAARTAHETLAKDVLAIRTYLVGTIKPTLKTIKEQLVTKEQEGTTSEDNSTTTSGGTQ